LFSSIYVRYKIDRLINTIGIIYLFQGVKAFMVLSKKHTCNIAILGAGSIGCYLGGCLINAGCDITLVGRARLQQQLLENGLNVTDWQGRNSHITPSHINYSLSDSELTHYALSTADYILVTVKSGDTSAAAQNISQYAKSGAVVVSFQNGVRNSQVLSELLPNQHVVAGMVPFNVLTKGAGTFHCGTEGNLGVENANGIVSTLIAAFNAANLPVDVYNNLHDIQWSKLIMNLNNAINALSGLPLKEELSDRRYRKVLALVIKEALGVLKVANIKTVKTGKVIPQLIPTILLLPNSLFKIVAASMIKIDPDARSSMYEDFALGRPTEIDYLNGEIVALAQKHNIPSPVNEKIMQLVKRIEKSQQGSPNISSIDLLQHVNKKAPIN
jgi:2-dehydropantoate 2-reductase